MYGSVDCEERATLEARAGRAMVLRAVGSAIALVIVLPGRLWAIPSPDLVVSAFASAAQVLGLITVVLGGFAVSARRRSSRAGGATARWAFRVCAVLFLASATLNILQYTRSVDRRNERLRAALFRSSTEGGRQVGDVNLKVLDLSAQAEHPRGITTEELEARRAAGESLRLFDVREPEEVESGRIAGATARRYPDLRVDPAELISAAEPTVLLCYSGNRSSELSDEFFQRGIETAFMIGGYEKWIAEGRPLALSGARARRELRELPPFPNQDVLLDTPEVVQLVRDENALFVDVRYPAEFAASGLPGAANVPMRKMPSDELWSALEALPRDRPIIAPCYDKRSSFYASILGLRLSRLGFDFRGRYTVPHEFVLPKKNSKAYVTQWEESAQSRTLLGAVAAPLRRALVWSSDALGHLAAAIIALVFLLRLAVLPLCVKAERDQIVQRNLAAQAVKLRERCDGDAARVSRALRRIQRQMRLTPLRNLAGSILQIVLFLVFFSVVDGVAAETDHGFLWVPSLGQSDSTLLLPGTAALLIFAFLRLGAANRRRGKFLVHMLCTGLLFALVFRLRAAVNLYLCVNLLLLISQSLWVRRVLVPREKAREGGVVGVRSEPEPLEDTGLVALRSAHRVAGAGRKAIRLAQMMNAGLPVPDGFAVTEKILDRRPRLVTNGTTHSVLELTDEERKRMLELWDAVGARRVAVRSSGMNEDSASQSYAGMFASILDVPRDGLFDALSQVHASLRSGRAAAYSGNSDERGGVLVQAMVDAVYAGVLFTEHPASCGEMLVELVAGVGEALVSGKATPATYRFGRISGRVLGETSPPLDLAPLLELGRRVERLFGAPQDIEWAYADGRFHLLQARDVTASARRSSGSRGAIERERARLLALLHEAGGEGGEVVLAQNELSELLPRPSPLSFSLMQALWAEGGSTDAACQALGVPYDVHVDSKPLLVRAFGALYVDRREEARRLRRGPGAFAAFRLTRAAEAITREFREGFLPRFSKETRRREAIDFVRLDTDELLELFDEWTRRFIAETYTEAEIINIAADFYLKTAHRALIRRGLDPSVYLSRIPRTVVHDAMALLPEVRLGRRDVAEFMELFGHRARHDYELAERRYREDPDLVAELIARAQRSRRVEESLPDITMELPGVVRLTVRRACDFQALKEEAKHHCLRELALLRSVLLELDSRLELCGGIFELDVDEIRAFRHGPRSDLLARIEERRADARAWARVSVPAALSLAMLETLSADQAVARTPESAEREELVSGTRVSGDREVIGRVRLMCRCDDIDDFRPGEILVTRFTDPAWTPLFPRVAGVITEVGGWLSHAAIVAREYNVTAIVGAAGALTRLQNGELVRLCADGRVERLGQDRRRGQRVDVSLDALLVRHGAIVDAIVRNLSTTGALIEASENLAEGQGFTVRLLKIEVYAEVVRGDGRGGYALRFRHPVRESLIDTAPVNSQ